MKRRTALKKLNSTELVAKLAGLRARRSRLGRDAVAERRHLRRAEERVLAEMAARNP